MNSRNLLRSFLVAAAAAVAPVTSRATVNWDGSTAAYTASSDVVFGLNGFTSSSGGLSLTGFRDLSLGGDLTLGGAFSFVQTGGGGLYQGLELAAASSTITATAITLTGDIGKQGSDGNSLTLNTSAANGAINLNVSLGRSNAWYTPASLTANAGTGTITVTGTNGVAGGWRSSAVSLTGGSINFTTGNVAADGAVSITNSASSSISTVLSGAMSLTKGGAGTLTMSGGTGGGASTFTGNVNITGGKLSVAAASAAAQSASPTSSGLGNMTTAGRTITVDGSGSILEFAVGDAMGAFGYNSPVMLIAKNGGVITRTAGAFNSIGSITLDNGGILRGNSGQNGTVNSMSINGNVTVTGTTAGGTIESVGTSYQGIHLRSVGSSGSVTFTVADTAADADLNVTANLIDPVQVNYLGYNSSGTTAGIIKAGLGRMLLAGTNGYTGVTAVNAGTLAAATPGAIKNYATAGNVTVANGATIEVLAGASAWTDANIDSLRSAATWSSATGSILGINTTAGDFTYGSSITTGGLTKVGTNTLTLTGSSTYTGTTLVSNGTLALGHATNTLADTGAVTVNGGTLSIGANSDTVGAVTLTSGSITGTTGVLSGSSYAVNNTSGTTTISAKLGGTGGLTKTGNGTLSLSGANTYTGATAINAGTVTVTSTGSTASGSAVSIANGATLNVLSGGSVAGSVAVSSGANLKGSGSTGAVTVADAVALLTAGDGTSGSLTMSSLTFTANGKLALGALSGYTSSAAFNVTGALGLGGTNTITIAAPNTGLSNGTYKLISFGSITGGSSASQFAFDTNNKPVVSSRQTAQLQLTGSTLQYVVTGDSPVWTGANSGAFSGGNNWKLISAGTTTDYQLNDVLLLDDTATGSTTVDLSSADVSPASVTFNNSTKNYTLGGSKSILTGSLVKSGSGSLTINNANSFASSTLGGGTVTVGAAGALGTGAIALNGGTLNINGQSLSNAIALGGGAITGGGTLSGVVSGSGAITKSDNTSLILSGANTYSGGTTLSAGTLVAGSGTALGTGSVALNGGTLNVNGQSLANAITLAGGTVSGAGTLSGVISGSGALTKSDNTSLTLSNANTYSGGTTLSAGTLVAGNAAAFSTGSVALNGGTIDVNAQTLSNAFVLGGGSFTGAGTLSGALSGSGAFTKSGAGTLVITNNSNFDGSVVVSAGTLQLNDARQMNGDVTVASDATLTLQNNANGGYYQPSSLTVNAGTVNSVVSSSNRYHGIYTEVLTFGTGTSSVTVPLFMNANGDTNAHTLVVTTATGATATVSGAIASHPDTNIAANGNVTKNGAGTLILSGANTFKGNLVINGGELRVAATVNNTSPSATALGDMTQATRTVTVNSGATLRFVNSDAIGQYNHKADTAIVIDGGTLTRDYSASMYFNSLGDITLRNGGSIVTATGGSSNVQSFAFNGSVTVSGTSGSSILAGGGANNGIHLGTVTGSTTFNVGSTGDATGVDLTVSAVLADKVLGGAATLVKSGAGRMVLSGANTYTGGTTVSVGDLVAANNNAFNSSGTVTLNDASTGSSNTSLLINATSAGVTVSNAISVSNQGSGTVTLGAATTGGSNQAIFSGAVTLNRATTISGGSAGDRLGFTGGITGTANVTIAGTSRVVFSGSANSYAGTTAVSSGAILQLGDATNPTSASFLGDNYDVTVNGTLSLAKGTNSETIAGLNGSGVVDNLNGGVTSTLVVGGGNANGSFSGVLKNTTGALALTKTGTGTQTLSGTNTYTGATSVSNGTLLLASGGSLAAGSAVSVASGATLSVASGANVYGSTTVGNGGTATANGALAGVTLNAGGTLRGTGSAGAVNVDTGSNNVVANLVAGNGTTGTLTLASLTFAGTGSLTVGALSNYTSAAAFNITGDLIVGADKVTLALPAGLVSNGTYKLISYGNTAATEADFTISGPVVGARQFGGLVKDDALKLFTYTIAGDSPIWTGANGTAFSTGSDATGNWKLINAGTTTDFLANDALLLDDTATGTTVDISGANVAPASLTFDNSTKDYVLQGTNGLSSGTLAKSGNGNLTINNANTLTSAAVSAGTLTLGNAGALGTAVLTLSGGTLAVNGQSTSAAIVLSGGAISGAGTLNGVVSGSGALAKSTAGTLTLNASNTYTGGTTVSNGVLVLGHATNTLADTGAVAVSGGELSLGSNSDTVGSVTLTGGSITGSGTLTGSSYDLQAGTVGAKLGGTAAATKTGAGTVTLSGANSYSGGTTVSNGVLAVGNDTALGSGTVALNGGSLDLSGQSVGNAIVLSGGAVSGYGTLSGTLSGSSAFTKSGSGALTLAGAQNLAGFINVTGGSLTISGSLNGGSYAGNIASNGSGPVALTGNANQTLSGVISGSAGLTKSGTGTLTLSGGANTLTGDINITGGTVSVTAASTAAQGSSPTNSGLGNMTVSRTITVGSGATLVFAASDAIGGYNYLTPVTLIADGGTITRSTTAGVKGTFNSIGNLTLRNGGALVSTNGNAPIGTLVGSFAINGNVTVDGTSATGATISPDATQTFQNYINLGTVNGGTTFTVAETNDAATADLTVSAVLANKVLGGAANVVKAGAGRMVLSAANAYTGNTSVTGGVLVVSGSNAAGGTYSVASGATLYVTGSIASGGAFTVSGGGTLAVGGTGGVFRGAHANSSITLGSGSVLELQNWQYSLTAGSLGGLSAVASSIVADGSTIRVAGATATTYGRGVTINSGGVTLEAASGANWTIDTVNDSNAWVYNGNPSVTFGGAGTGTFQKDLGLGTGAVTKSGSGTWTLSGANTYSGGTTVSNGTLVAGNASALGTGAVALSGGTLDVNGNTLTNAIVLSGGTVAGAGTLSGVISGAGSLTKSANGNLVLSGANTYSGGTALSGGTTTVGNDTALGTGAVTLSGGTLDVNGRSVANAISLSGGTLTGAGTLSGVLSGTGGISKSFAGTLTLSGANTFTGATSVTNGTLALASGGSLAAGSAVSIGSGATLSVASGAVVNGSVSVASGATLSGVGSVGSVSVATGSANLAAGSGTLTLASLAFDGTATLAFGTLASYTSAPAFSVTGLLSQTSKLTPINLALPSGIVVNGTYQLLSFGSTDLDVSNFAVTGPVFGGRQSGSLEKSGNLFQYVVAGLNPKWTGSNGSAFSGGGNWTIIGGDGSPDDYQANDILLVDDTATGTTLDISGANVTPTGISFDNTSKDFTLQGTHGISGGTLAKSGSGKLTLSNANTITSASILAGTVTLGGAGALDGTAVTLSGGTLDLNGQSTSASVALAGGSLTGSGAVSGVLSGSNGFSKSTAGTLTLSGTNTYTGGTTVSNGVLILGNATDTLLDSGAVTVSGGELSVGSNSDTVGAVTLTGGSITGTGTLTGSSYALQAGTVSAKLGGSAAVTKTGAGTVTLSGANAYSGGTTVSNGVLAVGHNSALGSGSVSLSGGTLQLSGQTVSNSIAFSGGSVSGTGTLSGSMSGSSAFTKSGNGTISLSGNHALASGVSVTGGTLASAGTLGGGTYAGGIAVSSLATFAVTSASNQTLSGVISGAGSLAKSGNGVLTLSGGASTFTGDVAITGGTVSVTAASTTAQGSSPTNSGLGDMTVARTITVGSGATLIFAASDAIGGYNYLTPVTLIADGGTITRSTTAGVKGTFNSIGNLTLRNGGALVSTNGNAALATLVGSFAINGNVTVDGTSATGATISPASGQTFQNYINLGTVNGGTTFTVAETNDAATADLTVSAVLADKVLGGAASLTKAGVGRMVLTGGNAYTGGTTINAGTLVAGSAAALGSGAVTLAGGALDLNGQTLTNAVTASGGSVTGAGTLSGVISGAGSLTKSGNGALVLSGANTFSGGLVVSGGSLSGTSAAAFGTGSITVSGGSLNLGGYALGNAITLSGGSLAGTSGLTGSLSFSNVTLTFSGLTAFGSAGINVGSGATLDLNFLNPTNTITLSGGALVNYANWTGPVALAGTVDASLINSLTSNAVTVGAGANVDLTGVSKDIVYTGGTLNNLSGYTGTLTVRGSLDLTGGVPASTGTVRVESGSVNFGGSSFAGTVQYVGGAVSNYTGAINVVGANVSLTAANLNGASLVLTAGNTATIGAGLQADLRLEGGSLSAGSLNNLTGTVTVAGNQLLDLGGSPGSYAISNAGMNIVVESGATLKGTASVGAITAQAGSILAPGNSPGQILADSLKPLAGSVYDFEIRTIVDGIGLPGVAGFDYDTITVAGELDLTGLSVSSQLLLNLITLDMFNTNSTAEGWDPATAFELTLYSYGTLKLNEGATLSELFNINSDGFLDANFASVFKGHFSVVNDTLNNEIHLVYSTTAIPEPSTYGLMLGGLALVAVAVRRRKNSK